MGYGYNPFALSTGGYLSEFEPPPPPRARPVGQVPTSPAAVYGSPAARTAMASIAAARQAPPEAAGPATEEPPSAPPAPAASPPTSGAIEPTIKPDRSLATEPPDEAQRLTETVNRLYPEIKPAGEPNPWAMAAMALPMLTGNPGATASMMQGYLGGRAARQQMATQIQEKRAGLLMPYYEATAAQRTSGRLAQARLDLQNNQAAFNQELQSAQFAFKEFQWANPSAFQKMQTDAARLRAQIRQEHQLAMEAIYNGRLDEYTRHNAAAEGLMQQGRDTQRQAVDIAAQALAQGRPGDAVGLYKFVSGKATDLQGQLTWVAGTPQEKAVQDELTYYQKMEQQLRPRVQSIGAQPQGGGFSAAGTGVERTYQTKYSGAMTASQVRDMIAKAKAAGRQTGEISAALQEDGIEPADFGY